VGGSNTSGVLNTIEEFDPATGSSFIRATLPAPRELAMTVALNGKIYIIGGSDSMGFPTGNCWEFDPTIGAIVPKTAMPFPNAGRAVAGDNGKIYVLGGITSGGFPPSAWSSEVLEYDPAADSWQSVGSLLTSRAIPMVASLNNTLYAIGGSLGGPPFTNNLDVTESAPLAGSATGGWTTRAPLPFGLSRASSGVVNGRLFIIGGMGTSGPTSATANVQVYDPTNDFWFQAPPFCTPFFGAGAATVGDMIYVAGGFDQAFTMQNSIYAYHTVTGSCWQVGSLTTPRARFSMAGFNNRLYSVGGSGSGSASMLNTIEAIDIATNSSSVVLTLPEPRVLAGVVTIGPRIYILGGSTISGVTTGCWVYDAFPNLLTAISPMKVATEVDEAVVVNGKIYVVSTFAQSGGTNLVQEYDPATDTWRVVEYVPTPRDVATIAALNGSLYVIGGDYATGSQRNEAWLVGSTTPVIDTTPPTTTATVSGVVGTNGWYTSSVQVTLTASDNMGGSGVALTEYYPVPMGSYSGYKYYGPMDYSTEGTNTLYFRSRDKAMNQEPEQSLSLNIDRTAPVNTATLAGTMGLSGWYTTAVTVTLSATDRISGVARTEYSYNNATWYTYSTPLIVSASGTNRVYYRTVDMAGNTELVQVVTLTVDRTVPTTSATAAGTAGTNGWLVSPATVTLTAVDSGSGVTLTEYSLDNGASWLTYIAPFAFAKEGTSAILYRATNNAGLTSTPKTLTVKIDLTPPVPVRPVERISVSTAGEAANSMSFDPIMTPDGRFILFATHATNLVPGTSGSYPEEVLLRDRQTGITEKISSIGVGESYNHPGGISADGRFVAWSKNYRMVQLLDRQTGTVEKIDVGLPGVPQTIYGYDSYGGAMSSDGRYVAFFSMIDNLVTGDTNSKLDAFVRDRQSGTTERVSVATDGTQANGDCRINPFISADGRSVVYNSDASNLVSGDTNGVTDIFVRDRQTGTTTRASVATDGTQANGASRVTGLSSNGRYVVFQSDAGNLVAGDTNGVTDVFVRDLQAGTTVRVSVATDGRQGAMASDYATISPDGRFVGFMSQANLAASNPNYYAYWSNDSYVRDLQTETTELFYNRTTDAFAQYPAFSANGEFAVFISNDPAFVPGVNDTQYGIYLRDYRPTRLAGTVGTNGWYITAVTATIGNASDAISGLARREYSLNGTSWTTYTAPATITAEGTLNLLTRSVDNAGLTGATATTVIKSDRTPPVNSAALTGTSPNSNGWYNSDILVTLTAQDSASGVAASEYTLNGADWLAYTTPFTITAEGATITYVRSRDNAGNLETNSPLSIQIDRTPPVTTVTRTDTPFVAGGTMDTTLNLAVTDNLSGVARTEYGLDNGAAWTVAAGSLAITSGGTTTVLYRSVDTAGNVEPAKSITVTIDKTPPQLAGATERVSVSSSGGEANNMNFAQLITPDGRFVLFASHASNLVAGTSGSYPEDVLLRDRQTGTTELISTLGVGESYNRPGGISADGRYVAYSKNNRSVQLLDRETGLVEKIDVGLSTVPQTIYGYDSYGGAMSSDGRYVAFYSMTDNLVTGDTNSKLDAFVRDRQTGITERVSIATDGTQANGNCRYYPHISADGRYVVFSSDATNLVLGDTNDVTDIFVRDRQTGTTTRVNVTTAGTQANGTSMASGISADGRTVIFQSDAANLVAGDTNAATDVFVRDLQTATTSRVSISSTGGQGTMVSDNPAISPDGRYVAFQSKANLAASHPGYFAYYSYDTYIRDQVTGVTELFCAYTGAAPCRLPVFSDNGQFVAFESKDATLVANDTNGQPDIFVRLYQPVVLTGTAGNNGWFTSDVQVRLAALEAGTLLEYTLNNGAWTAYTAPVSLTTEGITIIQARATDQAGNVSPATAGITAKIDKTVPVTTATVNGTAGQNNWYTSDVTVTLTATDAGSGVAGLNTVWTASLGPPTPPPSALPPKGIPTSATAPLTWRGTAKRTKPRVSLSTRPPRWLPPP
jgi:N-acetylneuraminic acid mutarotase